MEERNLRKVMIGTVSSNKMDKTVVVLIGAGVCCVVIGLALFVKLLTTKNDDSDEASGNKKLLDEEYAENFQEWQNFSRRY